MLQFEQMLKSRFLLILVLVLMLSCSTLDQKQGLEARAQQIDQSLICPVCPSETIDQSQVKLASQMRLAVREKLADGWTEAEVLEFFVERYGDAVLAAPPKRGFSMVAWIAPIFLAVGGLIILVYLVRNMVKNGIRDGVGSRDPHGDTMPEDLLPYLEKIDELDGGIAWSDDEPIVRTNLWFNAPNGDRRTK